MSNAATPRDFTIDYSLSASKDAVSKIIEQAKGQLSLTSQNDTFNTYTFTALISLKIVTINVQLKKASEDSTNIVLTSPTVVYRTGDALFIGDIMDRFLNLMTKALNGEELSTKKPEQNNASSSVDNNKKGNTVFGFVIVIIIFISLMFILFSCTKPEPVQDPDTVQYCKVSINGQNIPVTIDSANSHGNYVVYIYTANDTIVCGGDGGFQLTIDARHNGKYYNAKHITGSLTKNKKNLVSLYCTATAGYYSDSIKIVIDAQLPFRKY